MTKLDDFPTPETDAAERNFGEMPGAMRSLEQRLGLALEVLDRVAPNDHTWAIMGTIAPKS